MTIDQVATLLRDRYDQGLAWRFARGQVPGLGQVHVDASFIHE